MTTKTHEDLVAEINSQVVATVMCREVTHGDLKVAFEAVEDKSNWKNPIDKVIDLDPFTLAMVREAVIFFAGCVPSFEMITGSTTSGVAKYRVRAAGYYNAVGA